MSAATWDLIQRRDRQLKEWAAHVCLVRAGVAQVFQAWSRCSWLVAFDAQYVELAWQTSVLTLTPSQATWMQPHDMDIGDRSGELVERLHARAWVPNGEFTDLQIDAEPISAEDWDAYMQQAFRAEPVSVRLPLPHYVASRHSARMEMPPLRNFRRNILGAGNNRSVPEGSMPSEVWKLIFGYLPQLARDIYEQFFRQLARTGRNPSEWYDVPILPIDKGNGKPKCQGKRPIARLDSLAKQVHKTFYQACATTPRPDWAFGCIQGRRREEALAIVENNMFRCRRSKRNHAVLFRDAANAFPSLSHSAIAQHVRSQGAAHDLIRDAHANSLLGLQVPGCGVRKWLMGRGTRQGDTIAGDVFMDVYHVPLQAYKTATQDDELLLEYGNDVIDAAMTTYADDMVADSAEELDDKAVTRTALLEAELGGVGCQLEPSKEEVVMRWMGLGAHANRKTAMIPNKVTPGNKLGVARYLGGWVHNNGNKNTEIDKRISAMRVGFWAYAGVWRCQQVSLRAKRLFFKAMVQGAGLSGLEPYLLPKTALLRLERARDHLARLALGRAGWGAVHGDPRHESVPNSRIRASLRIHTIASTLRQRRLRWLQHMVRHPNHHKLYFASMFGRFGWEICRRELDDHGKPVQHAVPALRQMYDDLAAAVPEFQGFQPGWMQLLLACDPSFSWVLQTVEQPSRHTAMTDDAVQADDRQDPTPTPDLGWVVDVQGEGIRCAICAQIFDTHRALNMHEVAVHKKVVCPEVQTNQCPKCLTVFFNISSAERHFRASRDRPCAVDRGPGNSGTLLQPARHVDRQRRRGRAHAAGRAEESPEDPTANHKKLVRMMENLDYRLRQLEGQPCFFLPLEGCGLAQAMQAAAAYYDGRSPGKGKPHPDKHRKTTLVGALVKFAAERELQRLFACNFWKAKKDTKYVLTVQFQPHGVLAQVMPFIEFVILATGGLLSSGAPPKGAQVRGL